MATALNADLASIGKVIEEKQSHCREHGEFTSKRRIHINGRPVWSKCQNCLLEKVQRAEAKSNADDSPEAVTSRLGVGLRFQKASIREFRPANQSQEKLKMAMNSLAMNFKAVHSSGRGMVITGDTGAGKTYLCSALVLGLATQGYKTKIITVKSLISDVRRCYNDRSLVEADILKSYTDLDLLVIDEIGLQSGSNDEMNTLFNILNMRYELMRPTILTSNMSPVAMAKYLTARVYRRVVGDGGLVIQVAGEGL